MNGLFNHFAKISLLSDWKQHENHVLEESNISAHTQKIELTFWTTFFNFKPFFFEVSFDNKPSMWENCFGAVTIIFIFFCLGQIVLMCQIGYKMDTNLYFFYSLG